GTGGWRAGTGRRGRSRTSPIRCSGTADRNDMASVRYFVTDVDAAVAFYTGRLGFKLEQQFGPAMAITSYGDLTLWLAGPAASASPPMPDGPRPPPGGRDRLRLEGDRRAGLPRQLGPPR